MFSPRSRAPSFTARLTRRGSATRSRHGPRRRPSTVDQGLCLPDPQSEQNGTCGPQVAYDPAGRHLRHPAAAPDGRFVVATAYEGGDGIDDAIDGEGSIVLFDARSALPVRTLAPGPGDAYASFTPDGRGRWTRAVRPPRNDRRMAPIALDLPGPSRRIRVEPLTVPVPGPAKEPAPVPREEPAREAPEPAREPVPA